MKAYTQDEVRRACESIPGWDFRWIDESDDLGYVVDSVARKTRFDCYREEEHGFEERLMVDAVELLNARVARLGDPPYSWSLSKMVDAFTASIMHSGYVAWEATGPTVAAAAVRCVLASAEGGDG